MRRSFLSILLLGVIFISAVVVGAVIAKVSGGASSGDLVQSNMQFVLVASSVISCHPTEMRNSHDVLPSTIEVGGVGGKNTGVDYAVISPGGKYVIIAWDTGREDSFTDDKGFQHYGVEVFDRATGEYQRRVHPIRIHFDLGCDSAGHETLFATAGNNAEDLASFNIPDLALSDVVMVRLNNGVGTKLLDVPC